MKKYRIIRVLKGKDSHFEIQKKIFFWWITLEFFDCCSDGVMAGNYAYEFKTQQEAMDFIDTNNSQSKKILNDIVSKNKRYKWTNCNIMDDYWVECEITGIEIWEMGFRANEKNELMYNDVVVEFPKWFSVPYNKLIK